MSSIIVSDAFVKAVEDEVGVGAGAWDCTDPKEIISAAIKLAPKFLEQEAEQEAEQKKLLSAVRVAPGEAWYQVACAVDHPTLKVGDIVKMAESPLYENFLLRNDFTVHNLQGGSDQYVVLTLQEEP